MLETYTDVHRARVAAIRFIVIQRIVSKTIKENIGQQVFESQYSELRQL